jgi:hypothetical protein
MHPTIQEEKLFSEHLWWKILRNILYFGVPILVALSSVVFPITKLLRQAMIGFMLVWFVIGSWLFNTPKEKGIE